MSDNASRSEQASQELQDTAPNSKLDDLECSLSESHDTHQPVYTAAETPINYSSKDGWGLIHSLHRVHHRLLVLRRRVLHRRKMSSLQTKLEAKTGSCLPAYHDDSNLYAEVPPKLDGNESAYFEEKLTID